MTRQVFNQHAFNAGRLSPLLQGRQDVDQYSRGLSEAINVTLTPYGAASRRSGFEFVSRVGDNNSNIALVDFQINQDTSFMLEFGHLYIRFFSDGAPVTDNDVPYELESPFTSDEVKDIIFAQFSSSMYITHKNHPPQKLTRRSTLDWVLENHAIDAPATTDQGTSVNRILTVFNSGGRALINGEPFLAGDVGRRLVSLTGKGSAVITTVRAVEQDALIEITTPFEPDQLPAGEWRLEQSPIAEAKPTNIIRGQRTTVNFTEIGTDTPKACIYNEDLSGYIFLNGGTVRIDTWSDSTSIEGTVVKTLNSDEATTIWSLEQNAWTPATGYPEIVSFVQQRLVYAKTKDDPSAVWMSETGNFNNFAAGANDADSIAINLSSAKANSISWVVATQDLIAGTLGSESTLSGSGGLTPSNIGQSPRTYHGSKPQIPIAIGNEVIYIQRSGRKIRSMHYDFNQDTYIGEDITFFSEDITEDIVTKLAYAENPNSTIYAVDEAGNLLTCAYERSQKVLGWSKWETNGKVLDVRTVSNGSVDDVYIIVERQLPTGKFKCIERLYTGDQQSDISGFSDSFQSFQDPKPITNITNSTVCQVTCPDHGYEDGGRIKLEDVEGMTEVIGKSYVTANVTNDSFTLKDSKGVDVDSTEFNAYTGGGTANKLFTSVTGLDHLEGLEVTVKADAGTHPNRVVTNGAIELDREAYNVVVGLSYNTKISTLTPEFNTRIGSVQGQKQRRTLPVLRLFKSAVPKVNGTFRPSRSASDKMDEATPLKTGTVQYPIDSWDTEGKLTIETDEPQPLTILAIYGTVEGNVT